jgi:hypothetical protein
MLTPGNEQTPSEARERPCGPVLPEHLMRLINPTVLAARLKIIASRVTDPHEAVLRRRCAEVIANHLLQDSQDAA